MEQIRRISEDNSRIISLVLHKSICCGYALESPGRGDPNEYLPHMFLWRNKQNYPLTMTKYTPYLLNGCIYVFMHRCIDHVYVHRRRACFSVRVFRKQQYHPHQSNTYVNGIHVKCISWGMWRWKVAGLFVKPIDKDVYLYNRYVVQKVVLVIRHSLPGKW